ncbi:hypothetical protein HDU79_007368 [Rhizoclosmatium sp. JEL0117]|nr:hypothetical protein HDU79_007368 [Rhizoclosmatium sp. JEL0117]
MSCCGFFSSSIAPSASASRLTVVDNFPSEKIESPAYVPASNKHVRSRCGLGTLNGTISYERTETFKFNPDVFPKDFESPYIENVARELYARNIIKNKGQISHDGRLKKWPPKKKHWEAIIRYIGTLIQPREEPYEQSEILAVINYFAPDSSKPVASVSPTVFVTNMVMMGILEREMGGSRLWRRVGTKHPMPLGKGIMPNF